MIKLMFLLSLQFFVLHALAGEELPEKSETSSYNDSALRTHKIAFELQRELLGSFNGGFVNTEAFAVGYYLNDDWMIFVSRSYLAQRPFSNEDISFSANTMGIKKFVTDIFYGKLGFSSRDIAISEGTNQHLSATVTTLDLTVGLQKEISGFTYGADVIGFYSQPVTKSVKDDTLTSDDRRSSALSKARAKYLNIFVGWKF